MARLSRLFTGIFDKQKALARHVFLPLDNTSRDNKNSWIPRYVIKLRLLEVFETIYMCFPMKGHTHTFLDALSGQAVVIGPMFQHGRGAVQHLQGVPQ